MRSCPSFNVPVTTVPKPAIVKTLSTGRRGRPKSGRGGFSARHSLKASINSGIPSPFVAETLTIGAEANTVPSKTSRISSSTSPNHSSSVIKSIFVKATIPPWISRRSKIARCSRVWGITPSSAAITNNAASMLPTPANMFSMKSR